MYWADPWKAEVSEEVPEEAKQPDEKAPKIVIRKGSKIRRKDNTQNPGASLQPTTGLPLDRALAHAASGSSIKSKQKRKKKARKKDNQPRSDAVVAKEPVAAGPSMWQDRTKSSGSSGSESKGGRRKKKKREISEPKPDVKSSLSTIHERSLMANDRMDRDETALYTYLLIVVLMGVTILVIVVAFLFPDLLERIASFLFGEGVLPEPQRGKTTTVESPTGRR